MTRILLYVDLSKYFSTGRVLNTDCQPLAHAILDVWQCDADGVYDNKSHTLFVPGLSAYSIRTNARRAVHPEEPRPDISRHYHWFNYAWRQDCLRAECRTSGRRYAAFLHQVSPTVPARS